jgi:acyl carrier protein
VRPSDARQISIQAQALTARFPPCKGLLPGLLQYPIPIQSGTNVTPVSRMLKDQIKNYLVETAGVDPQKFDNPDLKVADLELDSLGLIEMLFEVEDKYGFQIPDPMVFLPMTFAEMVAAIDSLVQEHTKAQASKN